MGAPGQSNIIPPEILEQAKVRSERPWLRQGLSHLNGTGWIAIDGSLAFAAALLGFWFTPFSQDALMATGLGHIKPGTYAGIFVILSLVATHILGLHDPLHQRDARTILFKFFIVSALACFLTAAVTSVFLYVKVGRYILVSSGLVFVVLATFVRILYWKLTKEHRQRISIIGEQAFAETAQAFLSKQSKPVIVETLTLDDLNLEFDLGNSQKKRGRGKKSAASKKKNSVSLKEWADRQKSDELVVQSSVPMAMLERIMSCLDNGTAVISYSHLIERDYRCVPVDEIDARWFLSGTMEGLHPYYRVFKRMIDVAVGLVGLVATAPIMLLAAIAIKLESRGSIFYNQTRVGGHNEHFQIYKLRTMAKNAEQGGAQWAKKNDARVTRVGRILRKTRIDELPQFWNILVGDMAFIGPRPERPEFTEKLAKNIPFYEKRHMVKPGLTGWAQISYPYGASEEDARNKLKFDLFYVKHASLELDLHIIIRTIGAIMKGAR